MKRILLSTATVALIAFGACLLIGRQECAAVSDSMVAPSVSGNLVATTSEVNVDLRTVAEGDHADDQFAQATPSLHFDQSQQASNKRTIKVPRTKTVYEDQIVEVEEVTPLQQQYSVLMLKRAQRMSEEELKTAIEELEAELKEQDEAADAELQKAVEILNQLQENSVGTPAARRAAEALPVLNGTEPAKASKPAPMYSDPSAISFPAEPAVNPVPTY